MAKNSFLEQSKLKMQMLFLEKQLNCIMSAFPSSAKDISPKKQALFEKRTALAARIGNRVLPFVKDFTESFEASRKVRKELKNEVELIEDAIEDLESVVKTQNYERLEEEISELAPELAKTLKIKGASMLDDAVIDLDDVKQVVKLNQNTLPRDFLSRIAPADSFSALVPAIKSRSSSVK